MKPNNLTHANTEKISGIQSLLYEYYVDKLHWDIPENNPSGLKIKTHNNHHILVDDYDSKSIWFGVMHGNNISAAIRLCTEDENGLLEIERYPNASSKLKNFLTFKQHFNLVELNREALHFDTETDLFSSLLLIQSVLVYCKEKNHSILTTSNLRWWLMVYRMIGFPRLAEHDFKYFNFEKSKAKVFFADKTDIERMLSTISELMLNYEADTSSSIFNCFIINNFVHRM